MTSRTHGDAVLRPFESSEWETWRELRIRATRDSPDASAETVEELLEHEEGWWIDLVVKTVEHHRGLLAGAFVGDAPVGMAFGKVDADHTTHGLGGMWVAPEARGKGIGRALAEYVIDWGAAFGVDRYELWVTDGNDGAEELYRSLGYRRTNSTRPLRDGSERTIVLMERVGAS